VVLAAIAVVGVCAVLLVVNNSHDDGPRYTYPQQVQDNFTRACLATGGTGNRCGCALTKFEDRYPLEQFVAMDNVVRNTLTLPPEVEAVYLECG
jgi:hypothetical protein